MKTLGATEHDTSVTAQCTNTVFERDGGDVEKHKSFPLQAKQHCANYLKTSLCPSHRYHFRACVMSFYFHSVFLYAFQSSSSKLLLRAFRPFRPGKATSQAPSGVPDSWFIFVITGPGPINQGKASAMVFSAFGSISTGSWGL